MALLSFSSYISSPFQFFNPKPKPPSLIVRCKKEKKGPKLMKLVSSANTGFFYVTMQTKPMARNFEWDNSKFRVRKYDPRVKRHVFFTLEKIK